MTAAISTERVFSLPCFEGLRLFRKYRTSHSDLPLTDLLTLIESVEADARSLDMEASVYLSELVEKDCPLDGHVFYQTCIKGVLLKHQPIWAKLMRQGRQRFVKKLDRCAHHGDPASDSMNIRPPVPRGSGHLFHGHPATLF